MSKSHTRHAVLLVSVLLLCSCTSVENFGTYWDKGFIDPALEGSWKKIGIPGEALASTPGADRLVFTKDGSSYAMQAINPVTDDLPADVAAQRKKDNEIRNSLRSLKIGDVLVFMMRHGDGRPDGIIQRYEIKGNILEEYFLENDAAVDLLQSKYPAAANIAKNRGEGRYVVIRTFDDEVFRILSEMAADPKYWSLQCRYEKRAGF